MNKKSILIFSAIILICLTIFSVYKILNIGEVPDPTEKTENEVKRPTVKTEKSDNGFTAYSLSNIDITDPSANLIFLKNFDGTDKEELHVNVGSLYYFKNISNESKKIEVLELTDDYMTISIPKGFAPTKESGGFSLVDDYDKITIRKNTGICLNYQITDILYGNSHYFFYVNQ